MSGLRSSKAVAPVPYGNAPKRSESMNEAL
jgi:hypothetical protein